MLTVKASPEIGRTHGETVCVTGIRLDTDRPHWIRLFPVQWQWFWGKSHPKYQVIDIDVEHHAKDQRPESFRPSLDSVVVHREKSTKAQRAATLADLDQYTMCDLVAAKGWKRPSLGLVVPREIIGFSVFDNTEDSAHTTKMNKAAQASLLTQGAPTLELCPYTFKLHYRCAAEGCNTHTQTIVDWEISEAWRNWRHSYPDDYLARIEKKWLELVDAERKPALYVGNQHQAPQGFLVLGIARDVESRAPTPVHQEPSTETTAALPDAHEEPRLFEP